MTKVYARLDDNNNVLEIASDIFGAFPREGWTQIDEGEGDRYAHAQSHYLAELTRDGIPLYAWDGTKVVRRSDKDVQADIDALPKPEPQPDYFAFLRGLMGVE